MKRVYHNTGAILAFCFYLMIGCAVASEIEPAAKRPPGMKAAKVKVLRPDLLKPTPIENLKSYPEWLSGATIHACVGKSIMEGYVEFEVLESGYLFLGVNFTYQGNSSGQGANENWAKERWKKQDFINAGWEFVDGSIESPSKNDQQIHELCGKMVSKGETYKLRCNKYIPPFPIESAGRPGNSGKTYSWTGEVPFQKWQQFHSKVLAPVQSAEEHKITVTLEFTTKEGQDDKLADKVNDALKELGLEGQLESK